MTAGSPRAASDAEVAGGPAGTPVLSVAIATTEGWPYMRTVLESFRADAERRGVEVVVADGSGRPEPPADALPTGTIWMRSDSNDVFRLLAAAMRRCSAPIVATTEDHCTVRPGWCEAIVRAHEEHPGAAAIGGTIENGSSETLLDWGSYFITQGPHMRPLGQREVSFVTNEACLSQKRWAVDLLDDGGGQGVAMIFHTRALHDLGHVLRVDDRVSVDHFQSIGFRQTTTIHFHNGRTIAGFRRRRMTRADWLRVALAGLLPAYRISRILRICLPKRTHTRELLTSLPWAFWCEYSAGLGHLVGYATGPGDSPRHLR
ncbi:hypothetical protein BH20CHL6_BH20CHL6_04620 [soil metagenome]